MRMWYLNFAKVDPPKSMGASWHLKSLREICEGLEEVYSKYKHSKLDDELCGILSFG